MLKSKTKKISSAQSNPWKHDLKSGFLIFLIALPLSLGIAIACSAPPIAGIFTAMVGGLVASFLGSAPLTIKGPAAGLIVVILEAIQDLGMGNPWLGYKRFLAVSLVAAVFQIVLAKFKAGKIGNLVPPSVIHGMLAAIGIIIIAKQIHILLGVAPHGKSPLDLLAEIPESILNSNPRIALIGCLTLLTIFLMPRVPIRAAKKIPPAVMALVFVLPLAVFWHLDINEKYELFGRIYEIGPKFLVTIPDNLLTSITFPDLSVLTTVKAWEYVFMLAAIGSLESLLTVSAIDSLDPKKRTSDLDKDLFAVGVGNFLCALIGGLPMISEVVRSKANIDNGATSYRSNFFHGLFLFIAVVFFTPVIHEIPLSALSAMLIITGFRLSSPKEFYKTYLIGKDQLLLFIVTLGMTIATDLLIGVLCGILVKIVLHLARGARFIDLFRMPIRVVERGENILFELSGAALFTNYLGLSRRINLELKAKPHRKIILDLSKLKIIDHTTLHHLEAMVRTLGTERLGLKGLENMKGASQHELATRKIS